jgi:hypothetical protein
MLARETPAQAITRGETMPPPLYQVPRDETRHAIWERIVQQGNIQRIIYPHPPSPEALEKFERDIGEMHGFLENNFRPGEVEPLEKFIAELKASDPKTMEIICRIARDPATGRIVCCSYSTVIEGRTLAWRFICTDPQYRSAKLANELMLQAFHTAHEIAEANPAQDEKGLRYQLGETEPDVEILLNHALGRKRVYLEQDDGNFQELDYIMPHIGAWDRDTGEAVEPIAEPIHLHLMTRELGQEHATETGLREMLTKTWERWYVRPRTEFNSDKAYDRHREIVMKEILEGKILCQLEGKTIRSYSRSEREAITKGEGRRFIHFYDLLLKPTRHDLETPSTKGPLTPFEDFVQQTI